MQAIIDEKLSEIEKKEGVKILHCVESGSRAWGFASPDSDYDVRFIYLRPQEFYLRLDKTRDTIEWQLDETLDINGWDLQKALRLLRNSNPTLFEWNQSPIVYRTTDGWRKVSAIINNYFISKAGIYHYLSTAKGNYREYLKTDSVKLKKYFYVLRPILACKWIIDRKTPPPMPFKTLTNCYLDESLKPAVDRILELKINSPEIERVQRIDEINAYIEDSIAEIEELLKSSDGDCKGDWKELNELFLNLLQDTF